MKLVPRNATVIYNIALMGNADSASDGSPGTNYVWVVSAGVACTSFWDVTF
jgi:hypothetical protein